MTTLLTKLTERRRQRRIRRVAKLLVELDSAGVNSRRTRAGFRVSAR